MTTRLRAPLAFTLLLGAVLLTGCAPSATDTSDAGGDSASGSTSGSGSGSGSKKTSCAAFAGQTDPALKLFTTDAITAGPTEGQTYGDGTELAITLSADAVTAGYLPQFELNRADGDAPVSISSEIFDPTSGDGGTYSTTNKLFGADELVKTAMVMQVFAISDTAIGSTEKYGDKVLLGNYCLTYANDGS